jgi:hypothetical protein
MFTRAQWNDPFQPNRQQIVQCQITEEKPAKANDEAPISTNAENFKCQTTRCPAIS